MTEPEFEFDTEPSATRERSYDGGYMAAGRKAEEIILAWLAERPWIVGVEDFRALRVLREADVDCGIKLTDGRVTFAEIKSDRHLGLSGNFVFEVLRINHTAAPDRSVTLGWSARTPARVILFYAPVFRRVYAILADEFRQALQNYTRECRKGSRLSYVETDKIKSTINILVPETYVGAMPSYKVYELGDADYDAAKDLAGSIDDGFRVIRERKANGGPGWERKG